jgi:hypothetical protein
MTPTRDAPTGESSSARYVEESPMTRGFWHLWMVEGSIPSQWHLLLLFFVLIYLRREIELHRVSVLESERVVKTPHRRHRRVGRSCGSCV